jgi:fructokinase
MKNRPKCIGSGLITLDILIKDLNFRDLSYYVGGSCGNVLMILSHFGWDVYPISRLKSDKHAYRLVTDLKNNGVNLDYISLSETGSTPIIIQRNIIDRLGNPKHKFEFIDPYSGKYLPSFKSITIKMAKAILEETIYPNVFYFDRLTPGIIDLVRAYKEKGSLIVFEPSSIKFKDFDKVKHLIDIIKFSDQRIKNYKELINPSIIPLEIETMGVNGLRYRCNFLDREWHHLNPFLIDDVIDSSGAGDWSSAAIIYYLQEKFDSSLKNLTQMDIENVLLFAQKLGALNCTFEGARGLMKLSKDKILKKVNYL